MGGSQKFVKNVHCFDLSRKKTINRYNYRANLSPDSLKRAKLEIFENGGPWEAKASRPWKKI